MTKEQDRTLAVRLKEARTERGLSQTELAALAGVSQTTIASIETGRASGSKYLPQIAQALDVNVAWLITETGWDNVRAPRQQHHSDGPTLEIYELESERDGIKWRTIADESLQVPRMIFARAHSNPDECRLLLNIYDDMEPFLFRNDIFMIDMSKTEPREGKVYLVLFEGDPIVRQISKQAGGALLLHAFNPRYADKVVPSEHIDSLTILGQCLYRAGPGLPL
ncbi:XRE family transcriptional regulator [Paraburkholderia xenovorans]|uniref:XRE family transcriptional regulator n=1 Tax=Paraburkholderia xenovorans TaxID=36873 RepID=UPI001558F3F1|nr:XRE family transcriptional regulator [Paraburkholderia xenovorans]NPT36230.1 helix-turn-helix domain-containing protein [Paraburkholderia xenovorans]